MKKIVTCMLLVVSLVVSIVSFSSCGAKPSVTKNSGSSSKISSVASSSKSSSQNVNNQASSMTVSQAKEEIKKLDLKGATIKMISNLDGNSPENLLLKSRFKTYCNGNIIFITVPWEQYADKLVALLMSGQSPDIYSVRSWDYPGLMYKDLFIPLEDNFDLNSTTFSPDKPELDKYMWNGKHYFYCNAKADTFIWYNKRLMSEAGVEKNPSDLVKENKWDWNTFLDLAKQLTDTKNSVYGFGESGFQYALLSGVGEDIIKVNSNSIVSNVNSPNVAKAMEFYGDLYLKYKVAPPSNANMQQDFANGKLAMMYGGQWFAINDPIKSMQNSGEVSFTHIPKYPGAADYVYPGNVSGYAIPKGASNVKGAVAFITMGRVSTAYAATELANWHKTSNHNAEEIQVYAEANKSKIIPIYSYGVNAASRAFWNTSTSLTNGTAPWLTLAQQLDPQVQKAIADLQK